MARIPARQYHALWDQVDREFASRERQLDENRQSLMEDGALGPEECQHQERARNRLSRERDARYEALVVEMEKHWRRGAA